MRDIRTDGDLTVGRDFIIHDNSQQEYGKPLFQCSNEELFVEKGYRKNLLAEERNRKISKIVLIIIVAVIVYIGVNVWSLVQAGNDARAELLIESASTLFAVLVSIKTWAPTEFELRQQATLKEIAMLLRERGVE